jgi:predicted alpha-1,6-mannanase (GH76 family)
MALIGYIERTGDERYLSVVASTYRAAPGRHAGFVNDYYDDNGWWALTWIAGWDAACGGGLWWNTARTYKNAITNELFLALAARLHQRAAGPESPGYLDWALRQWRWFAASGLIGSSGLINDGLTRDCRNNGGPTWSYNQGVILGGLTSLFQITRDRAYLRQAETIADAALGNLVSPAGVLQEPCELLAAGCDGDQTQFKGIFVRNLAGLYRVDGRPAYRDFLLANAVSVWGQGRDAGHQFGSRWTGPFDVADASRQSSALEAFNAALAVGAGQS